MEPKTISAFVELQKAIESLNKMFPKEFLRWNVEMMGIHEGMNKIEFKTEIGYLSDKNYVIECDYSAGGHGGTSEKWKLTCKGKITTCKYCQEDRKDIKTEEFNSFEDLSKRLKYLVENETKKKGTTD